MLKNKISMNQSQRRNPKCGGGGGAELWSLLGSGSQRQGQVLWDKGGLNSTRSWAFAWTLVPERKLAGEACCQSAVWSPSFMGCTFSLINQRMELKNALPEAATKL